MPSQQELFSRAKNMILRNPSQDNPTLEPASTQRTWRQLFTRKPKTTPHTETQQTIQDLQIFKPTAATTEAQKQNQIEHKQQVARDILEELQQPLNNRERSAIRRALVAKSRALATQDPDERQWIAQQWITIELLELKDPTKKKDISNRWLALDPTIRKKAIETFAEQIVSRHIQDRI